jgi:hypothetical protein
LYYINPNRPRPGLVSHTVAPASANPLFLLFGVEFVQAVNGEQCPLQNGLFNAMTIVRVDGSRIAALRKDEAHTEERNFKPLSRPNDSPVNLMSEGQWITVPSKIRTVRREQSPLIGLHIRKMPAWRELLVQLQLISPAFTEAEYSPADNDSAGNDDDRDLHFDNLPGTSKSRDG